MTVQLTIAIAGAAGGFVKSLVEQNGKVVLPYIEVSKDKEEKVSKYVHLGFLFNVIIGAIVAYYTMTETIAGFTTGVTAAFFIEKLLERTPVIK